MTPPYEQQLANLLQTAENMFASAPLLCTLNCIIFQNGVARVHVTVYISEHVERSECARVRSYFHWLLTDLRHLDARLLFAELVELGEVPLQTRGARNASSNHSSDGEPSINLHDPSLSAAPGPRRSPCAAIDSIIADAERALAHTRGRASLAAVIEWR